MASPVGSTRWEGAPGVVGLAGTGTGAGSWQRGEGSEGIGESPAREHTMETRSGEWVWPFGASEIYVGGVMGEDLA